MTESSEENATKPPGAQPVLKSERIGARLTGAQIDARVSGRPGWELVDGGTALWRTVELPSFRAALAFLTYVVELAEAKDHRAGVELHNDTVTLTLTNHSAGGLTERDFELASRIRG